MQDRHRRRRRGRPGGRGGRCGRRGAAGAATGQEEAGPDHRQQLTPARFGHQCTFRPHGCHRARSAGRWLGSKVPGPPGPPGPSPLVRCRPAATGFEDGDRPRPTPCGWAMTARTPARRPVVQQTWIDPVRVVVIGAVIAVHAATAYVVPISWYYQERTTSTWTPVLTSGVVELLAAFGLARCSWSPGCWRPGRWAGAVRADTPRPGCSGSVCRPSSTCYWWTRCCAGGWPAGRAMIARCWPG